VARGVAEPRSIGGVGAELVQARVVEADTPHARDRRAAVEVDPRILAADDRLERPTEGERAGQEYESDERRPREAGPGIGALREGQASPRAPRQRVEGEAADGDAEQHAGRAEKPRLGQDERPPADEQRAAEEAQEDRFGGEERQVRGWWGIAAGCGEEEAAQRVAGDQREEADRQQTPGRWNRGTPPVRAARVSVPRLGVRARVGHFAWLDEFAPTPASAPEGASIRSSRAAEAMAKYTEAVARLSKRAGRHLRYPLPGKVIIGDDPNFRFAMSYWHE